MKDRLRGNVGKFGGNVGKLHLHRKFLTRQFLVDTVIYEKKTACTNDEVQAVILILA